MAKALQNPGTEPTYLEFFGFSRPPFARLSQPSQIFHTEQYSLLLAHLAAATEQPDCLVVICGADGSGKTTLLNRYITSLADDVCFASIDESCNGEKDFYCAFLRQLGFSDITGTSRELWRITKEFLVHRGTAGEPVLMIIDNAHLIKPNILEQLRRMSTIRVNNRRVLSVVVAGTNDLNRIIDSPAMSEVQFHSQVHFNIRVYTEGETANYVWHRLRLAGGSDLVNFANDAHPLIYRYTGGIPKLINMLCNELLTTAFNQKSHEVTEELVRAVADDHKLLPHVVPLQGRRRSDPDFKLAHANGVKGERITPRDTAVKAIADKPKPKAKKPDAGDVNLLEQISELSAQVGELRADRMKALEEIDARDKDNAELRTQLDTQTAEVLKLTETLKENTGEIERLTKSLADSEKALQQSEVIKTRLKSDLQSEKQVAKEAKAAEARGSEKLAGLLEEHEEEIRRLKKALSDNMKALQQSEKASDKLTTELEKERKALRAAEADVSKSRSKAENLDKEIAELRKKIDKLAADLKKAEARDASHLEAEIKKRDEELVAMREELESRDEAISDLKKEFKDIQKECASLRLRVAARKTLEDSVSAKEARIADLQAELDSQSEEIEQLKLKHASPESADSANSRAEQILSLESGIREARKMLTGMNEQLRLADDSLADEDADTGSQEIPVFDLHEDEISLESGEHEFLLKAKMRQRAAEAAARAEAPGTEIGVLEVTHDGEPLPLFRLPKGEARIMIGRSEDSELRLKSEFVSRHHALIIRNGDGIYIEDLNSFNGTIVNSEKVSRCKLKPGDVIVIGRYEIKPRVA